jgi:hypothetical protein
VITTAALKCSGTVCCYQKHLLLCTGMLAISCYAPECWQLVVMHWNVGNLLLYTGMLSICCYALECWQFVVMYWNVGNLLLCTGMLAICCYALECWQFVVMHWNVDNSTIKRTNKIYTADLIFICFTQILYLEKLSWSSSILGAFFFQLNSLSIS